MDLEPGDVVFVPFPFRDRLAESVRPAVVVSRTEFNRRGDLVLAVITSHDVRHDRDVAVEDWQAATLAEGPLDGLAQLRIELSQQQRDLKSAG